MTAWSIWIELVEGEYISFSDKVTISLHSMKKISVKYKESWSVFIWFWDKRKICGLNFYRIKQEDWCWISWEVFKVLVCVLDYWSNNIMGIVQKNVCPIYMTRRNTIHRHNFVLKAVEMYKKVVHLSFPLSLKPVRNRKLSLQGYT